MSDQEPLNVAALMNYADLEATALRKRKGFLELASLVLNNYQSQTEIRNRIKPLQDEEQALLASIETVKAKKDSAQAEVEVAFAEARRDQQRALDALTEQVGAMTVTRDDLQVLVADLQTRVETLRQTLQSAAHAVG